MKAAALIFACAAILAGCASGRNSSEAEWERAQCNKVIDSEARDKCMERVDRQYGRR